MMPTIDFFEGGKKQTVGFHGMFDSTYLIAWIKNLLDSLATINVQNAVIVMDDAKYHKSIPENIQKGIWKKQQLVDN